MSSSQDVPEMTPEALSLLHRWLKERLTRAIAEEKPKGSVEAAARGYLEAAYAHSKSMVPEPIKSQLFEAVLDEVIGLGEIQFLVDDPTVTEIMVNGVNQVYVERNGLLEKVEVAFAEEGTILRLIDRIVRPMGRRIDANSPMVDARLPDGSRVNAVIPPVAVDGPGLTIRKFARGKLPMADLIRLGSLTEHMAEFMKACVASRLNIVVSGGTGSGKTTLLNVLSEFVPEGERIVTIEDAAELQLSQEHIFRLEAKPPDLDGSGEVPIRQLVRNALRMRPDRIVVGEVRGGEALDMLQAMNTGHDGSLTTVHANSPRDAISRLETLVLQAGFDLPLRVVREQIASAVDVIVQVSRLRGGSRRVTSITEVIGMEGDVVVLNEIFKFEATGGADNGQVAGEHRPTGMRPMFEPRLVAAGFRLAPELFGSDSIRLRPPQDRRR